MKTENELPVIWERREYRRIVEFDCHVVDLETMYGGGYFTVVPISPKGYRKKHPTRAKVEIIQDAQYTNFHVTTDWGNTSVMQIPNHMTEAIENAKAAAIKQELLKQLES